MYDTELNDFLKKIYENQKRQTKLFSQSSKENLKIQIFGEGLPLPSEERKKQAFKKYHVQ
jgi:hypothetical protein